MSKKRTRKRIIKVKRIRKVVSQPKKKTHPRIASEARMKVKRPAKSGVKRKPGPKPKKPNVDVWTKEETKQKQEALERASREFDDSDSLNVHTIEAVYGKESNFGANQGKRGSAGAAGEFQMEKATAERMGMTVTRKDDQRFNLDTASVAEAKYLKKLDGFFTRETDLGSGLTTISVSDPAERTKFDLAANNAGEGRIANAQRLAQKAGKDPAKWDDVKEFLSAVGASDSKVKETTDYVNKVKTYEGEFKQKSSASESDKDKGPTNIKPDSGDEHWITKDGKHILIDEP